MCNLLLLALLEPTFPLTFPSLIWHVLSNTSSVPGTLLYAGDQGIKARLTQLPLHVVMDKIGCFQAHK